MDKKNAFIVVVKSPKKMDFQMESNGSNAQPVVNSLMVVKDLPMRNFGLNMCMESRRTPS
jgi:hypothetical protein